MIFEFWKLISSACLFILNFCWHDFLKIHNLATSHNNWQSRDENSGRNFLQVKGSISNDFVIDLLSVKLMFYVVMSVVKVQSGYKVRLSWENGQKVMHFFYTCALFGNLQNFQHGENIPWKSFNVMNHECILTNQINWSLLKCFHVPIWFFPMAFEKKEEEVFTWMVVDCSCFVLPYP